MSVQSGLSRRWQKVRRATGRIPLRIKLISAVLTLVLIALGAISIGGQAINISQNGTTCTYALQSSTGTVPGSGGAGSVGVLAASSCGFAGSLWCALA